METITRDPAASKKEQARRILLRELRSGGYTDGALFPSENVLARRLGICKNTVREAFSALVNEGLLERVRGKGTFVRGRAAAGVIRSVHLLIGDFSGRQTLDPFIGGILTGLHHTLDPRGWTVRTHGVNVHANFESTAENAIAAMNAGECLLVAGLNCPQWLSDRARAAGVHLATVGRPEDPAVPFVHGDNRGLTRAVVRDLTARGHRHIAFADNRATHAVSFDERREGFLEEMTAQGLTPDARLLLEYQAHGTITTAGREIWQRLRATGAPFTALVIYGDWAMLGLAERVAAEGVRVPGELSLYLLGCNPLCTADTVFNRGYFDGSESMGSLAGELFLRLEAGKKPENVILPPRLYPGNSVGAPADA